MRDKIIEQVINKIKKRSDVGYKKYGVTLQEDDQSLETWLTHIQEELMDAVNYIEKARKLIKTPLMLTGGFRSVSVMEKALEDGNLDVIGLARPFCLYPNLASQIFNSSVERFATPIPQVGIKFLDKLGGIELPWYELQIQRIGKGKPPKINLPAILAFWFILKTLFFKSFLKNK